MKENRMTMEAEKFMVFGDGCPLTFRTGLRSEAIEQAKQLSLEFQTTAYVTEGGVGVIAHFDYREGKQS